MQSPKKEHYERPAIEYSKQDFLSVLHTHTVDEALQHVRKSKTTGRIIYFYVLDEVGKLKGVLPTRRLLLSPPATLVADIMVKEYVAIPESATLLDACEFFILHRLLALPLVDRQGRMIGVVDVDLYTDEVSDLNQREQSEDLFQLIGVRLAQVQQATLPMVFARRFPWLLCNILGGLACALLAGQFEGVLQRAVSLSLFIPVVLAIAESVSIQTLSLALQARHGNRFRWGETLLALSREAPTGALLGIAAGGMIGMVSLIWLGDGLLAMTLLIGIFLSVATSASLGLIVPTALLAARRDPKIASGPIVLTLTDLCTLSYYLGLAAWLL